MSKISDGWIAFIGCLIVVAVTAGIIVGSIGASLYVPEKQAEENYSNVTTFTNTTCMIQNYTTNA
ncbi:unnamed protein product, partial [Didymodactylos carnosus]